MGGDFNPGFFFALDTNDGPAKTPWEFGSAMEEARKEQKFTKGTTLDAKIREHRKSIRKRKGGIGQEEESSDDDQAAAAHEQEEEMLGSDASNDDSDTTDEEDAPLPGEREDESEEEEEDALPRKRRARKKESSEEEQEESGSDQEDVPSSDEMNESDDDEEEDIEEEGGDHPERPRPAASSRPTTAASTPRDSSFFSATPASTSFSARSFTDLHLSRPLVKACEALGYSRPTPIQAACIPLALTGRDICGSAMTGSGKTGAFALPLLERLLHRNRRLRVTYALILAPARELAVQVQSMITNLAQFTDIRVALAVGGLSLKQQEATMRTAPEVVVATPGRLIDLLRNTASVGLEDLAVLILDEADRLLEMGFMEEIKEIVRLCPRKRQTLLFSATLTDQVKKLAALSLKDPIRLAADERGAAPRALTQEIVRLKGPEASRQKEAVLLALCARSMPNGRTIIFFRTKQGAHRMKILFGLANLPTAAELHGNLSQAQRLESLELFRRGEAKFLLATDVAARGLDILGVQNVINYDAPRQFANYLHRIGRTARAGRDGRAVSLMEDADRALLKLVVKKQPAVKIQNRVVPPAQITTWQERIESYEPAVKKVQHSEWEEMMLRKAEMEAEKASNMLEHHDEIHARPPRTWFQTEKEKQSMREKLKESAARGGGGGDDEEEDGEEGGANKRSAADKAAEKRQLKKKRAAEADLDAAHGKKQRKTEMQQEMARSKNLVRKVKAMTRGLREQGLAPNIARKLATKLSSQDDGTAKKKRKHGLFEGDGASRSAKGKEGVVAAGGSKVYAGGARSQAPRDMFSDKKRQQAIAKAKKGNATFKSKARYKRR